MKIKEIIKTENNKYIFIYTQNEYTTIHVEYDREEVEKLLSILKQVYITNSKV